MAQDQYDAIVIGAGQNGLTVAAYLAKVGLKTLVLEQQAQIGGSARTMEVTVPGFKHDIAGSSLSYAIPNPALKDDELGLISKYGFNPLRAPDPYLANVYDDGTVLTVYNDVDRACGEIAKFSRHDAKAYKEFQQYLQPMLPILFAGMYNAPPKMGLMLNQLDQSEVGQELMRLLFMSSWDLAKQWFTDPHTLMYILNFPSEAMVDPYAGGSALYVLNMVASHHMPGHTVFYPEGGIQTLPDALARVVEDNGGAVLANNEVVEITTANGRATGVRTADGTVFTATQAVISNVDPRLTLNRWLDTPLEPKLKAKIGRISDAAFVGEMVHLALDKEPHFKGGDEATDSKSTVFGLLPSTLPRYRQYFADLEMNRVPLPERLLAVFEHRGDRSRVPNGKALAYIWQFVPYRVDGEAPETWDERRQAVGDAMVDRFLSFTNNLSEDDILGRCYMSPMDYERHNQAMYNGSVMGPLAAMHQYLAYRPVPELGQYRTPVGGLYLSGQSMHPGGGLTMGGRATAQAVMADLGIDFEEKF